jgi:hypothetical protein
MKRGLLFVLILTSVCALPCWSQPTNAIRNVNVVVGDTPSSLDRFAASELCDYLQKLYELRVHPSRAISGTPDYIFFIGNPKTNKVAKMLLTSYQFPTVSDQGFVLQTTTVKGRPALVIGGGSSRATLWAVYDLVERWGVRYLQDRDVYPPLSSLKVQSLNVVKEPVFRVRAHPSIQDYAPSGESWGLADFRPLIDQLAKLKFNRLNILAFGYQPYLDWGLKGVQRNSAHVWYDYHYPIMPDMVGRQLFDDRSEFWNPDLPLNASYKELVTAGERQIHNLIQYAHERGMEAMVFAPTTDFPPEFAPLLKGAVQSLQLTIRPGPDTPVSDPELFDLSTAVLRATLNTYPEADYVSIAMPEETQWLGAYEEAWKALDAKYGINQIRSLSDVLASAEHRKGSVRWPGLRGLNQAKADIMALDFYDRLLRSPELLKGTLNPNMKFMYSEQAEELFPLLGRILPKGWEVSAMPENQPEHFLPRAEILDTLPTDKIPGVMDVTLDDDVVGIVPQFRPTILARMLQELQRRHWSGFTTRERFPGDHDVILAFLGRAAWDSNATPDSVAQDLLVPLCGEKCAAKMRYTFSSVEKATLNVATNRTDFGYYIPKMLMKFWVPGPTPAYLQDLHNQYEAALKAATEAEALATPEGRWYPAYWVGRLKFALGYAETVAAIQRAATAEAANNKEECRKQTDLALTTLRNATESYVSIARTRTDVGAVAVLNEYGIRPLNAKLAELSK